MLLTALGFVLQVAATDGADAKLLRDARTEQFRFEALRRTHLPRDRMGGSRSGTLCDARIGRYCYWYDSTETPPVPEPKRITEARATLIAFLDSAAAHNPTDAWVVGQRTRYLIEGGFSDEAVARARECRAERWWCAALEGLALHDAQRYAIADSMFAVALREMPADQRCEWTDLRLLASDGLGRELSRANCDERAQLADRLWTVSQPLWSTEGNDLRTEHFARLTMAEILERSANAHGMPFGADSRELMVRYGWSEWYTREDPTPGLSMRPGIIGHDREPSYAFFPSVRSVRGVPRLTRSSWRLRDPGARMRYAPRHVKGATVIPHQLIRFPRRDSMLVAVAFRVSDTALMRDSLRAYLGVYANSIVRITSDEENQPTPGLAGALWMAVGRDTMVASIEARGVGTKRIARARYTIDPLPCGETWCVSDLLLFDPDDGESSDDVDRALSHALTEAAFSVRRPLGVHWEIQGKPGAGAVWLGLTVTPIRVSAVRRLATRLHLAPEQAPVRLRWQATVVKALDGQSVTLRLPANARGTYRVVLTVDPPDAPAVTAMREIELVP